MTTPEVIMWLTVAVVGVPSMWRNPTAAALVLAWLYGVAVCLITGDSTPLAYYPFADVAVLGVIWTKRQWSNPDRIVVAIYPVCWAIYVAGLHDYYTFYLLLALTIVQMFAAGTEAFESYRRDAAAAQPGFPGDLLVALRSWGHG